MDLFLRDNFGEYTKVEFNPTIKELDTLRVIDKNDHLMLRKDRQVGLTTLLTVATFNYMVMNDNHKIVYIGGNKHISTGFIMALKEIFELNRPELIQSYQHGELILTNQTKLYTIHNPDKFIGLKSDWVIYDDSDSDDLFNTIVDLNKSRSSKITLVKSPYGTNRCAWKEHYFKTLLEITDYTIYDYRHYECHLYNQEIKYVRGTVEIDHNGEDAGQRERLLAYGFKIHVPAYEQYLRMFGYDDDILREEFDRYLKMVFDI